MAVMEDLQALKEDAQTRVAAASTLGELEEARVALLGKKGAITRILRSMGSLAPEERPLVGKRANELRGQIEAALAARKTELQEAELQSRIAKEAVDVTLPGRAPHVGTQHLISQIVEEMERVFVGMGYDVLDGPYVETTYYNFDALNSPPDHPSRSPRDTFYVADPTRPDPGREARADSDLLLRTQTSPVQVHAMEAGKPPIYMISPGRVFRPDTADANHIPQFTQIEGLVVDEGITFGDLKGTLDAFTRAIFGKDRVTRWRPHFFPFTEPSAEVDVSCGVCGGKGCRFCKGTGWLEILGCGMVDPNVLQMSGIDPERYSGFAFGIGAERVACLRYDLPDLRALMTGDMRFLAQF